MKSIYKLLILILSLTIGSFSLHAQEIVNSHNKEVGLRITSFNSFGLLYKKKIKENKWRRFRAAAADIIYNSDNEIFTFALSASIGTEKRKNIANQLEFLHGWETELGISLSSEEDYGISATIGYVLGLQHHVSDRFVISLETIPRLSFYFYEEIGPIISLRGKSSWVAIGALYKL